MRDPRYERRRRAAVPCALAAFTLLLVVSGAGTPATWAGASAVTPAMTILLPAQQAASAPSDGGSSASSGDAGSSADASAATAPSSSSSASSSSSSDSGGGSSSSSSSGGSGSGGSGSGSGSDAQPKPQVRHVFLVVLRDTDLVALAGDAGSDPSRSAAPYFAGTLVPKGTLLTRYDAIARGSLANEIALLSGQGPTAQTLAGCPTAAGAKPADVTPDRLGADGQQLGDGCVYPFETGTMPDQLTGAGLSWRAYLEDTTAADACPATPRDPFAYFHSLLDTGACARHVAGLDKLDADLARGRSAPALLYVVPGACHDGAATPCAPGAPAGPAAADAFLRDVAGRILASPAYADGGLLVVTSDDPPPAPAPTGTTTTVTTTPAGATTPTDTTPAASPAAASPLVPPTYPNVGDAAAAGAARVGALLVADAVRAGVRSDAPASHFTLLRAISDLFALQPLGYAGTADLRPLPDTVLAPTQR